MSSTGQPWFYTLHLYQFKIRHIRHNSHIIFCTLFHFHLFPHHVENTMIVASCIRRFSFWTSYKLYTVYMSSLFASLTCDVHVERYFLAKNNILRKMCSNFSIFILLILIIFFWICHHFVLISQGSSTISKCKCCDNTINFFIYSIMGVPSA